MSSLGLQMDSVRDYYNNAFATGATWFKQPHETTKRIVENLRKQQKPVGSQIRVLDLGCGQGRDAIYFAQQAYKVTAVDFADQGIAFLERKVREFGLEQDSVQTIVADISNRDLWGMQLQEYDAIVCYGALHFLAPDTAKDVLLRMRRRTRPDGFVGVTDILDTTSFDDEGSFKAYEYRDRKLFTRPSITALYEGCDIIYWEEGLGKQHRHGDGPLTQHYNVSFVARKF